MQQNLDDTTVYMAAAANSDASGTSGGHFANDPGESEKPKKKHHVGRIVLIVLVVLAAAVWGAGAYAFTYICYPGTTVLGADLSLMDVEEAAEAIEDAASSYELTVTGTDFSWTYTPSSVDEIINADELAQGVLDENDALAWPVHLVEALTGQREVEDELADATAEDLPDAFDRTSFEEGLASAVDAYNEGRSGTFDVDSAFDEGSGLFTVEAARANELLDVDALTSDALQAVARLEATLELDRDDYVQLADGATDEELQEVCDAANALIGASITLTMGGTTVATLDSSTLFSWLTFGDDGLSPTLDTEPLSDWVTELASSLDTVGTARTFTGGAGDTVTISGGTFGWEVDQEELLSALQEAVAAGSTETIEVPTTQEGDVFTAQGEPDWDAYVEVDISEQWAWYFDAEGNVLWESGVITGNPNKGNDTPQGVYYINAMYQDITLMGEYDEETDEYSYESPVSYWMAFVGSSVGFHDATWQSESNFGNPDAYLSVGSHGCVNLSLSSAEELYSVLEVGVCVIVHE